MNNELNITQTSEVQLDATNTVEILGSKIYCSGGFIDQEAEAKSDVSLTVDMNSISEFVDTVANSIENEFEATQDSSEGFMGGFMDFGSSDQEMNQEFNTVIKDDTFKEDILRIVNETFVELRADNNFKMNNSTIDPCGITIISEIGAKNMSADELVKIMKEARETPCPCPLTKQKALADSVVDQVLTAVLTDLVEKTTKNASKNKGKSDQKNTSTGPIQDFFDGVAGLMPDIPWEASAAISAVVLVLGLVAMFIMMKKKKPSVTNQMAQGVGSFIKNAKIPALQK